MAYDERLQNTAYARIKKYGRAATLHQTTYDAALQSDPSRGNTTSVTSKAIYAIITKVTEEDVKTMVGGSTVATGQKAIIAAKGFTPDEVILPDAVLEFSPTEKWTIKTSTPIKPAELPIVFKVMVSK